MREAVTPDMAVGLLVAERPARAAVLEAYGIDYCCGGKLSLRWFCNKRGLDVQAVLAALAGQPAEAGQPEEPAWREASLAELVGHLTRTHHAFLRRELPRLDALAAACAERSHVMAALQSFRDTTLPHLDHEERVVFPLIVRIERGLANRDLARRFLVGQLQALEAEHARAGEDLEAMRQLMEGPMDAELKVGLAGLIEDTHRHVHKENGILFPRALALVR